MVHLVRVVQSHNIETGTMKKWNLCCTSCDCERGTPHGCCGLNKAAWYAIALHAAYAYTFFCVSFELMQHLNENLDLPEETAGWIVGIWGALSSIVAIVAGFALDRWGLKFALITGSIFTATGALALALLSNVALTLFVLCIFSIGTGLYPVALHIVLNRSYLSDDRVTGTRSFYVLYSGANLGAVGALATMELAENFLPDNWNSIRVTLLLGAASACITVVVSLAVNVRGLLHDVGGANASRVETLSSKEILRSILEPRFRKLLALSAAFLAVGSIFRYAETLLPSYFSRVYGEHSNYEIVLMVNPLLIVPTTLVLSQLRTSRKNDILQFVIGSGLASLTLLPMWLWTSSTFAPSVIAQLLLTLGEAVYAPRLHQYIIEQSPRNKQGIYSGLIQLPEFFSMLISGQIAGYMLENVCPADSDVAATTETFVFDEHRAEDCNDMFGYIFLTTLVTPVMLLFMRGWLENGQGTVSFSSGGAGNMEIYVVPEEEERDESGAVDAVEYSEEDPPEDDSVELDEEALLDQPVAEEFEVLESSKE